MFWQRMRLDEVIEAGVRPVVDALNAMPGVRTIASCEGHALRSQSPYVYFHASVFTAAAIEMRLRQEAESDPRSQPTQWALTGLFNEAYELAFSLRSPLLDRIANSPLPLHWAAGLRRATLDAELLRLSRLIQQVVLPQPRIDLDPEVAQSPNDRQDAKRALAMRRDRASLPLGSTRPQYGHVLAVDEMTDPHSRQLMRLIESPCVIVVAAARHISHSVRFCPQKAACCGAKP